MASPDVNNLFLVDNLMKNIYIRLEHDILLTHSAPAIMRTFPDNPQNKSTYLVPGEVIIWRWFGIDRFFPPGQEEVSHNVLHGCSSVCTFLINTLRY